MIAPLLLLMAALQADPLYCSLGEPITVTYNTPGETVLQTLDSGPDWNVLEQSGNEVTLVPLALDTLDLPPLAAAGDSSGHLYYPGTIVVQRTMPDSSWSVGVFPAPLPVHLPPGFPGDYLHQLQFWEKWRSAPGYRWILPVSIAALLIVALVVFILLRRRRRSPDAASSREEVDRSTSPLDQVRALLDSDAFAMGNWVEYYSKVDILLRDTVTYRFGLSNRALTWYQIRGQLGSEKSGRKFTEDVSELVREIILQRYASWGGSRDRARRFTGVLSSIREEWHRK